MVDMDNPVTEIPYLVCTNSRKQVLFFAQIEGPLHPRQDASILFGAVSCPLLAHTQRCRDGTPLRPFIEDLSGQQSTITELKSCPGTWLTRLILVMFQLYDEY